MSAYRWDDEVKDWIHLSVDIDRLTRERDEARAAMAEAHALLECLVDRDPCWFDHHGGCQAHGYLTLKPGEICPQQEAKNRLAAAAIRGDA